MLGGAVAVSAVGTLILRRRSRPVLEQSFDLPTKTVFVVAMLAGMAIHDRVFASVAGGAGLPAGRQS